ncbi:MAG: DUF72 domain-containing protein [Hymenobacteraceae bacterium]|nr:DUF72 domain-containing protein [Hymenobacteraceae bacterium]MDX5512137.1 DUF72 domain-containing protein [Hymenobacteraceae bacterium]
MKEKPNIHIGTSGWHYKHWMGNFYPPGLKSKDFTNYYLQFFRTVEINNSFYKLPTKETFANWYNSVPEDFVFAVKGSRFITHMKKLKDPQQSMNLLMENVSELKEKLGPILFQLPPLWKFNEERFRQFLQVLPPYYRYTFEFRNPTWYNETVYELLRQHHCAFCIYELAGHVSPILTTTDFVYIRLHGPNGKYAGSYPDSALSWWANRCLKWQQQGLEVYVYFDNDEAGYAAFNAKRMLELLKEKQGDI